MKGPGAQALKRRREVANLKTHERHHASKYLKAFVFGQELAAFWGDIDSFESPEEHS